ncbi:hypothetical protein F5X68DRAFT_212083 [Plectosphaerella plurivora]|uniref:Uncharacterized protein n=1 Tax=Plectosphaerella plurivora TaxID=936078 RepID=A0A9P8V8G1_9PEZI|nr:hypothetical protein F5X68DRAFT_212083 [Plectosphaerella plurivora]
MPLSFLLSQQLLPLGDVQLGRFTTSIEHPLQNFNDPEYGASPEAVVSVQNSFVDSSGQRANSGLASSLTSLLTWSLSRRAKTEVQVEAETTTTYTLRNSEKWFTEAISLPGTRRWIMKAAENGYDIHMVVAFHAVTNSRINRGQLRGRDMDGKASIPVGVALGAAGVPVPFSEMFDIGVSGTANASSAAQTSFEVPGEYVCAQQYRRLRYRWLSSKDVSKARLSQSTTCWSCLEGRTRDPYQPIDEDDIFEVEIEDMDRPDGEEWESRGEGEDVVLARVDSDASL